MEEETGDDIGSFSPPAAEMGCRTVGSVREMVDATALLDGSFDPFAVLDGGLSTALEELGERPAGVLWTAHTLLERPEVVTAAHRSAVDAGADLVISSSYQASEEGFVAAGLDATAARRLLGSTTEVARRSGARLVACSVGPYGAFRADGSEYHGRYDATWDEVRAFHRRRLEVLVDSGPDLFAIETMPSAAEAQIVVEELRRRTDAPAWVSFTCRDESSTSAGDEFTVAVEAVSGGVQLVGVNCTAPHHVQPLLRSLGGSVPAVVYPNHGGVWDATTKCWADPSLGAGLVDLAPLWVESGAVAIGGCCGVGTDGVAALAHLRNRMRS